MSTAPITPPAQPRPALRVISSAAPRVVREDMPVAAVQDELPLQWRADRRGTAAASELGTLPALPLDAGVPRPDPHIAHVSRLFADVLAGVRPATHLQQWASLEVEQAMRRRSRHSAPGRRRLSPASVVSTHAMTVSGRAVLVAVVFRAGGRAYAAALRLEYRHRRWIVTAVESPAPRLR